MIKKTITYTDYNGFQRTEDHYFNLTRAEVVEMEVANGDLGMSHYLKVLSEGTDPKAMIAAFKDILKDSYGRKSPNGRTFEKSDEIWKDFESSEAYSQLFFELATDADAAAGFFNNVIPSLEGSMDTPNVQNNRPTTQDFNRPRAEDGYGRHNVEVVDPLTNAYLQEDREAKLRAREEAFDRREAEFARREETGSETEQTVYERIRREQEQARKFGETFPPQS